MHFTRTILPLLLPVMLSWAASYASEYKKGETYHGFRLLEKRFVKEVNAECFYFEHTKSGARLFKIAADDPNKTFSISFKTVPESDCGTPHIIEHSVLNGSKNFPVKSPFDVLSKGSLQTFLNAFTGSDMTMYPVASMNNKDYFNLMHIYLDAVFNPLIYSDTRILKQEGWHHEMEKPEGPVVYKGVVYNEMKGAYSSPTRELDYQIMKNLFPENGYRFSSGGYPSAIPKLTYESFLNFHKKYYHPSNSHIFVYGDADLDKELQFIDAEYLNRYDKSDINADFPLQKSFSTMKEVNAVYPVTEGDKTENQAYLNLSFVTGLNTDRALVMALNILCDVLVNQEAAPVRIALNQAGIGQDVNAYVDEVQQNVMQITVQNANPADKDKFREIVFNTLKQVVKNGLDKKAVEGTLNRLEFRLREGDDAQKGLTYNFQLLPGWFFANDPFLTLEYEKPLEKIKESLDKNFLESVIEQYITGNPHSLLLVLSPQPGLEKEINEKMTKELEEYKNSLSDSQINDLIKETKALVDYQKREDTPEALAAIPMLDRKDINPKAEFYTVKQSEIKSVPVLHHEEFTNGVVYTRFLFDARVLPAELLPYAALLAEVLGSQSTDNYSFGDLDNTLNIHTGGFNTYLSNFLENQDDNNLVTKFVVDSKSLNKKTDKLFELASEIINHTRFADIARLRTILNRHQSRLEEQIKENGLGYTQTRLFSYFSKAGMVNEQTRGIEYYWFITKLAKEFDKNAETIVSKLAQTAGLLFKKENLIASVTCGNDDLKRYNSGLENFTSTLPSGKIEFRNWDFTLDKKNEGMQTASKVQYVVAGYNFKKLGYSWNGKIRVLEQILGTDYLQNRIRVIGGAYGGMCSFSPNGMVVFSSYRDPNLRETLENYSGASDYLGKFEADEKAMTRFIIGTIAQLDNPLTPSQKGYAAVRYFLEKRSPAEIQSERDDVLSTTLNDIREMQKMVSDIIGQKAYCVYGNEEKINTNKDIFGKLIKLDNQQ